ncbi:MAG: recombinase family protein [Actinomycetota bacterium]
MPKDIDGQNGESERVERSDTYDDSRSMSKHARRVSKQREHSMDVRRQVMNSIRAESQDSSALRAAKVVQERTPKVEALAGPQMKRAILYLRVSTPGQARRGGEPEGYSLPAQRDACIEYARQISYRVIDEYIDPGESATSDKRPMFQKMLTRIREQQDVDAVVIWSLSRLSRRRLVTSKILEEEFAPRGVTLISVRERFDYSTPAGRLTLHVLDDVNQYSSEDLADQVLQGMTKKADLGGTPFLAPLGYLNKRRIDPNGSKDIRFIEIDPERAPIVRWLLNEFSTGDWVGQNLLRAATEKGLRNRPTRNSPEKPLSLSQIYALLRNPYYMGVVSYRGIRSNGTHEPLVTPEVWLRIQDILDSRDRKNQKDRKHPHFLRGTIYCSECRSRLCFSRSKGRSERYDYFFCLGKARKRTACQHMKYVPVDVAEASIEKLYERLQLPPDRVAEIRRTIRRELDIELLSGREQEQRLEIEIRKLKGQQEKLLDAYSLGTVPSELLNNRMTDLTRRIVSVESLLAGHSQRHEKSLDVLSRALKLSEQCAQQYKASSSAIRRQLNQGFFKRIFIGPDGLVKGVELQDPFALILREDLIDRINEERAKFDGAPNHRLKDLILVRGTERPATANSQDLSFWRDSNKRTLVEVNGFEPSTSALRTRIVAAATVGV